MPTYSKGAKLDKIMSPQSKEVTLLLGTEQFISKMKTEDFAVSLSSALTPEVRTDQFSPLTMPEVRTGQSSPLA